MEPRFMPIRTVRGETHDTVTIELDPEAGGFEFLPGQFNMLYAFGIGEVPISISGDPEDPERLVHTIRRAGAVTKALCGMGEGDLVGVRGPFGTPWPVEQAEGRDVVLVAGGIGLAPVRPVMYHILNHRVRYERVALVYGARSPRELLFGEELAEWRSHFDLQIRVSVDTADRRWRGSVGVVTTLIPRVAFEPAETASFVCGPEIMMTFAAEALLARGVPKDGTFLSMERNMKCGIGFCGHCQFGKDFVCKDGPVFNYEEVQRRLELREV
jgi:NAD(P)H-flavin reductase